MMPTPGIQRATRHAATAIFVSLVTCAAASAEPVRSLDQGWSDEIRQLAYSTPQGSRLIPYRWFLALEQPTSTEKFASRESLSRFGFLYDEASSQQKDGLPIGFAKDPENVPGIGHWLGLTCTACHTGEIEYRGTRIRIDGAPSSADIGAFLDALANAVRVTRLGAVALGTPAIEKFGRFAREVYGHEPSGAEREALGKLVDEVGLRLEGEVSVRTPPRPAGAGRIDALGQIINALAVTDLKEPENLRQLTAPVSFPFLWLTPRLDFVQWTPVAGIPISRNAGEALGVFAHVDFTDPEEPLRSTILLEELGRMEEWFDALHPPVWPKEVLGGIDPDRWQKGKQLFHEDCQPCHNMPPYRMSPPEMNEHGRQFIQITRVPITTVATDSNYTKNLVDRRTKTGTLRKLLFREREIVEGATFFLTSVGATLRRAYADQNIGDERRAELEGYRTCGDLRDKVYCSADDAKRGSSWTAPRDAAISMKAGPLFGIWATGPFLHNGSVPNLYELLSPAEERSKVFWVGRATLDTKRLGFESGPPSAAESTARLFRFDTSEMGNGNGGHLFPRRGYSEDERMAVIEFLKDPGDWALPE